MELMNINKDVKSFEANGKTYYFEDRLSIERFIAYQKFEVETTYNGGFAGVMRTLKKVVDHLNKLEIYNAIVEISNIIEVLKKSDKDKYLPSVNLCSLFLNTKDEDRRYITNEQLDEKQKDFETAGIPADFFLHSASRLIAGYRQHLNPGE